MNCLKLEKTSARRQKGYVLYLMDTQDEMDWFDHSYVTESSFYPIYY